MARFLAVLWLLTLSITMALSQTTLLSQPKLNPREKNVNETECELCLAGSWSPIETCSECDIGFCPLGLCEECKPGSFSPKDGSADCTSCSPGSYQPDSGKTNCTLCEAGHENPEESGTSCSPCSPGTLAPEEGTATCALCADGWTSTEPYTNCYACAPGSCCPSERNEPCVGCVKCEAGSYQSAAGRKVCMKCPYGSYAEEEGTAECTSCGSGRYLNKEGSTTSKDCQICPLGYYCPAEKTQEPILCPDGAYCPEGSSAPLYCNDLFYPDPTKLACVPSVALYVIIVLSCIVVVAILGLVIYNHRQTKREVEIREEASKLLKSQNSGPTYQGL